MGDRAFLPLRSYGRVADSPGREADTSGNTASLCSATGGGLHSVSVPIQQVFQNAADLPVAHIRSMDQIVIGSTARDQFNTLVLAIFAVVAILLSSIGLYGLMAYSVEQRTLEFGIRLALGADTPMVRKMIVRQAMTLACAGMVVGLAAAYGLTRLMASLLFSVRPTDPVVFVSVTVLFIAVSFLASYLPAQRTLRVNPVVALRYELRVISPLKVKC